VYTAVGISLGDLNALSNVSSLLYADDDISSGLQNALTRVCSTVQSGHGHDGAGAAPAAE
jgi:hypothetical protein